MVELVNTLLNVSRLELGTFKVEPKQTDVIALAQDTIKEQKLEIEQKKLVVTDNFGKDVPTLLTDPKLLYMVFQNLLSNAVDYTPDGGKIEFVISFDSNKKTIMIKMSDTGYGIPKNQQDQIFKKLFRADNIREKKTNGTGLGLYIVKSIVENSGGKIWFESPGKAALGGESPENPGTTFYVTLPLDGMKKSIEAGSSPTGQLNPLIGKDIQ
jgi:signal transduction histidine kinase